MMKIRLMKTMTLKGLFLCLVFLLCNVTSYAADDLITKQITIQLDKAGILSDKIEYSKRYKITNLKIIGEINGTDLRMIRKMAGGADEYEGPTDGKLAILDLSEAKIVSGGDYYYIGGYRKWETYDDVIGGYAFTDCRSLTSIVLPSSAKGIEVYAFKGCRSLTNVTFPTNLTYICDYAFDS